MTKPSGRRRSVEQRFWEKVAVQGPDDCWLWTACKNGDGYGNIFTGEKVALAHRVSWELLHGKPFPDGLEARHLCDNPPCVNPRHIEPGTKSQNMRDSVARGSHAQLRKTHCPSGHPYNEENVHLYQGRRYCLACRRMRPTKRNRLSAGARGVGEQGRK